MRGSLFQLSKADDPLALPQAAGPSVTLSEKLTVPVNEYPDVCKHDRHCANMLSFDTSISANADGPRDDAASRKIDHIALPT